MEERKGVITFMGNPLTLVGPSLKVGDKAPDFTVLDNNLNSVPSLDTPVCDLETRRFNQEAATLGSDVAVLTVSMDLPFAQKRWCGAAGVDKVTTLSDHRDASFGTAYGVLIKELRLLARYVFVVDRDGVIRYIQVVKEMTKEPDYGAVLDAVRKLLKK
jgi:thiol peroxidase